MLMGAPDPACAVSENTGGRYEEFLPRTTCRRAPAGSFVPAGGADRRRIEGCSPENGGPNGQIVSLYRKWHPLKSSPSRKDMSLPSSFRKIVICCAPCRLPCEGRTRRLASVCVCA